VRQLSSDCRDFDDLRRAHEDLLTKLRHRVLLKKAPFMIDQIKNSLLLCAMLAERYEEFMVTRDKYLNDVGFLARQDEQSFHLALEGKHAHEQQMLRSLQQIEQEFDNNMKMLMMIIQKLVALGGAHHLLDLETRLNFNH
jgi:Gamma tubulin complex component C-terminal